ncbi:MAG: DUF5819 family protein [Chloroflexota bacterium]
MTAAVDGVATSAQPLPAWWRTVAVLLMAAVVFHFALVMTTIVAPPAIPAPLQPLVQAYLVPFFVQDWRLFSPIPDTHDYEVFVRGSYRTADGHATTPWLDLIEPTVEAVQRNRLSPHAVRIEILHKAALFTIRAAGPYGELGTGREIVAERWATVEQQPATAIVLERLGSAYLAERYPERQFETVQVMVGARPTGGPPSSDAGARSSTLLLRPVPFQDVRVR